MDWASFAFLRFGDHAVDAEHDLAEKDSDQPSPHAVTPRGPGDCEIVNNAPQNERPSPALCVPAALGDHALDEAQPVLQFLLGGVVLHASSPLTKLELPQVPHFAATEARAHCFTADVEAACPRCDAEDCCQRSPR